LIARTIFIERYRSLKLLIMYFSRIPCYLALLGPNIPLSILFSYTFLPQCERPTTGKIIFLYILIFKFLDSKLEDKRFCTEWQQAFPDFNLLLISSWIEFWSVKVVTKYMKSSTLSKAISSIFNNKYNYTPITDIFLKHCYLLIWPYSVFNN
jgi:hypothetical protein